MFKNRTVDISDIWKEAEMTFLSSLSPLNCRLYIVGTDNLTSTQQQE